MKKTIITSMLMTLALTASAKTSSLEKQKQFLKNHADEAVEACTSSSIPGMSSAERQSVLKNQLLTDFNSAANDLQNALRHDNQDTNYQLTDSDLNDYGIWVDKIEISSKNLVMFNQITDGNGTCSFYNENGEFLNSVSGSEDSEWTLDN